MDFLSLPCTLVTPGSPVPCVAITGAGGKTSLSRTLAVCLRRKGKSVLVTTTTHIFPPEEGTPLFLGDGCDLDALSSRLFTFFRQQPAGIAVLAEYPVSDTGKLKGLSPERLCALREHLYDLPSLWMLVEADGSARHPLKAHAAHEPLIPACADAVIAVAGLDALGKTLAEAVHRPELAAERLGLSLSCPVTAEIMACLLTREDGPFRGTPSNAAHALFLNQTDLVSPEDIQSVIRALTRSLYGKPTLLTAGSVRTGELRQYETCC